MWVAFDIDNRKNFLESWVNAYTPRREISGKPERRAARVAARRMGAAQHNAATAERRVAVWQLEK